MGRSAQAYADEIQRRIDSGELDRAADPYNFDVALDALRRIAQGTFCPAVVARVALDRIAHHSGRPLDAEPLPLSDTERMEWLSDNPIGTKWTHTEGWTAHSFNATGRGRTVREAIDVVIRESRRRVTSELVQR